MTAFRIALSRDASTSDNSAYRKHALFLRHIATTNLPRTGLRRYSLPSGELAVPPRVQEVDQQSEREPDEEADPGDDGQSGHQAAAEDDRDQREERHHRHLEAARTVGLRFAQE